MFAMENLYCYLIAFLLSIVLIIKLGFTRQQNLPPSPFALPIIGHLYLIKKPGPFYQALGSLSSKYGPIMYLRLGARPVLVVSSASAVEDCFTKNDIIFANRPKSMAGDHFTYNYTSYAWADYGHIWRTLRRFTVIEIFSSNNLKKSFPILQDEVHCLLHQLFTHSASGNQKVELKPLFSILSTNFMMRIVAGKRGTEEVAGAANMEIAKKFLLEFKEIFFPSMITNICDLFPILRLIGYSKGIEKSYVRLQKMRDEYMQNLIDDIRIRLKKTSSSFETASMRNKSLIETLLSLQESEPEFYSDDVLKSIIVIMFIAGVETTAVALEWAMSLLLNNPDVLQKVRAEIDCNVANGRMLNDVDLVNLPYLCCVIKETLRLYPPAPLLLPHFSSENCIVGGYHIPRGTTIMVNAWAMHRDSKVWEEPNKFKPERFEGIHSEREGFKHIPFGMGRRACPGAAMAIRTISFALGSLIQCFEWEKIGAEVDMTASYGLSLSKTVPLVAMCSPRQNMIGMLNRSS
ncbi:cytochrome P450 family 81 subfamily K polypeptide 1 [Citrus sinensis]|uniref:Cytochrome P450 family 81 subfamily K polypeptide 1 n=2 Tax=Citrus sinensis TaxID=2711 RepID=A0ACB8KMM4_CITSI|nr:cytochrome P450 family 81 subfamily K polypeptide 1 [Citrus sinensis]